MDYYLVGFDEQYTINNIKYFKVSFFETTIKNIPQNLDNCSDNMLNFLAKVVYLQNRTKMTREELIIKLKNIYHFQDLIIK